DNGFKARIQWRLAQKRAEAIIPVGDRGQTEATRGENIQGRQNILKYSPGIHFGEALVKGRKESPAGRRICQAGESFIDELRPVITRVKEAFLCAPGEGKVSIENVGR